MDAFYNERLNERSIIESVLSSYYILDYGYIKKVNADMTVDVVHAKKPKTSDGKSLEQTITKNIEMLTLSCGAFSLNVEYKQGDKVLLLGLKDYVPQADDVSSATEMKCYLHYTRETIKALPLCVFNDEAKVKVEAEAGTLKVTTNEKIELNGNSKQFVTWAELNQALTQFVTSLNTALLAATYINVAGTPTPLAWTGGTPPTQIDISGAKTTTVVTGG